MSTYDDKKVFKPSNFEYLSPNAEVVIVGITPGNSQLSGFREGLSLREIKRNYFWFIRFSSW